MSLAEEITFVGNLLDAYSVEAFKMGVAAKNELSAGVPPAMHAGEVEPSGWVEWKMLPSTLQEADVAALEAEFGVRFPSLFRAYLLARHHLFKQVHSNRFDQLIFMTATPTGKPLKPLRDLLFAWRVLIDSQYVPFAQWGDGWGPMCFDAANLAEDGECPIMWFDHEVLIPLGEAKLRQRAAVLPFAQPLYDNSREFLLDVFG